MVLTLKVVLHADNRTPRSPRSWPYIQSTPHAPYRTAGGRRDAAPAGRGRRSCARGERGQGGRRAAARSVERVAGLLDLLALLAQRGHLLLDLLELRLGDLLGRLLDLDLVAEGVELLVGVERLVLRRLLV